MNSAESPQEKPDGERWLELIGYGHLKGQPTGHEINGQPVLTEEFNKLCDDHTRPALTALENMDPSHPRYGLFMKAARAKFEAHFIPTEVDP